jgi:hypothetical protein
MNTQKICMVPGCGRKSHGKQYCGSHMKEMREKAVISKEVLARMRSSCCSAKCSTGDKHEYGEQYCTKCGAGCCWTAAA